MGSDLFDAKRFHPPCAVTQGTPSYVARWLRAAVRSANDGIVSIDSLMLGEDAVSASSILVTGVAGLMAVAISIAAGEYVLVQSEVDTERTAIDIDRTRDQRTEVGPCGTMI